MDCLLKPPQLKKKDVQCHDETNVSSSSDDKQSKTHLNSSIQ